MKNMEQYKKTLNINWATPLLGLITAHHLFAGNIEHWAWWILVVVGVLAGNWKR